MLVSHESPLSLLEESRQYNDYDYCLVHLLEEYPQYVDFFVKSKSLGRKVLLDNSMFELREAFEPTKFTYWINKLDPDEYIVPDVFSDKQKTIESFETWKNTHEPNVTSKAKKIGVVQGDNYQDMIDCYLYMRSNADKIAFSFECKYFRQIGYSLSKTATVWHRLASGRSKLIKDLTRDGIWDATKPHHLLGCALPQEFRTYVNLPSIVTIDTSNPVVAGMHNIRYNDYGLDDKIEVKLADSMENEITPEQHELIRYNIKLFREINRIL